MIKRMTIMLLCMGLLFGGLYGFQTFKASMIRSAIAGMANPQQTVSTAVAEVVAYVGRRCRTDVAADDGERGLFKLHGEDNDLLVGHVILEDLAARAAADQACRRERCTQILETAALRHRSARSEVQHDLRVGQIVSGIFPTQFHRPLLCCSLHGRAFLRDLPRA